MPALPHPGTAALSQEFPRWTLWVSGTGRLWASRRDALTAADVAAGCVAFLHADGPGALGSQLRIQEALRCHLPRPCPALGTARCHPNYGFFLDPEPLSGVRVFAFFAGVRADSGGTRSSPGRTAW